MVKRILLGIFLIKISCYSFAGDPRNFLQQAANPDQLKSVLSVNQDWITYPSYTNREGWDALTGSLKSKLVKDGEAYLKYAWKPILATDYLEYERSGNRSTMEGPYGNNNKALSALVFAELAEGKGRFMDQIINGVWLNCDMPSWALAAHLPYQKTKRNLPDYNEVVIDLGSSDMGSFLSWTWYFFHAEFDKTNPIISARLNKCIRERILEPYLQRSDYWWQALSGKDVLVNNWNPWCNFNVMTAYLLIETDPAKMVAGVYKTMQSTDMFINYVKGDGACEEGPSYWTHAAGKLYDYLILLQRATHGKVNIFDQPMIKKMGEYIVRSYVGNGWVVNFADASAKGGGEAGLIYRYGQAVNSSDMLSFAAYLLKNNTGNLELNISRDFFRTIENISIYPAVDKATPALPAVAQSWYPETQFCYVKTTGGLYFAAKAGFNNESHNHNDVGTFNLYADETPFFIDAGVGTYTRQTFGPERYTIWTMQSNYHNLPMINGKSQSFGAEYKARDVSFNAAKNIFTLDMAGAYPKDAQVRSWVRTYTLADTKLVIDDQYDLSAIEAPSLLNFLVWSKPDIEVPGKISLEKDGKKMVMAYDASVFSATVEPIPQTDKRLSTVWGDTIYRISLTARKTLLKGKYHFVISKG